MDDIVRKPYMAFKRFWPVEIRNSRRYTKSTQGIVVAL